MLDAHTLCKRAPSANPGAASPSRTTNCRVPFVSSHSPPSFDDVIPSPAIQPLNATRPLASIWGVPTPVKVTPAGIPGTGIPLSATTRSGIAKRVLDNEPNKIAQIATARRVRLTVAVPFPARAPPVAPEPPVYSKRAPRRNRILPNRGSIDASSQSQKERTLINADQH